MTGNESVICHQMMQVDVLKTAAMRLDRIFRLRGMEARIVMLIHDAIWIEAPAGERTEARRLMENIMSTAERPLLELMVDFSNSGTNTSHPQPV